MTSQNFFLDFSVLDTMYRWSMIKTSTAQIGWESVQGGPEIWPHGYLISPTEISVNWPGSKQ